MARLSTSSLLALCAVLVAVAGQVKQDGPHVPQGSPLQNQGRARRQAFQYEANDLPNWTTCDFTTAPIITCADCNTRMICKPVGGLLKTCDNPLKPYCNNGICSNIKVAGC